jgi:hypothetical protein
MEAVNNITGSKFGKRVLKKTGEKTSSHATLSMILTVAPESIMAGIGMPPTFIINSLFPERLVCTVNT